MLRRPLRWPDTVPVLPTPTHTTHQQGPPRASPVFCLQCPACHLVSPVLGAGVSKVIFTLPVCFVLSLLSPASPAAFIQPLEAEPPSPLMTHVLSVLGPMFLAEAQVSLGPAAQGPLSSSGRKGLIWVFTVSAPLRRDHRLGGLNKRHFFLTIVEAGGAR